MNDLRSRGDAATGTLVVRPTPRVRANEPLAIHAILRLVDGRVLVRSAAERRLAAMVFIRHGARRRMLAFRIADDHAHMVVACSRAEAGELCAGLKTALGRRLAHGSSFDSTRYVAIADQRHLMNAIRYVLRQEARHGLELDPCHDGSSLPDLVGLRVAGSRCAADLAVLAPRLRPAELWSHCGMPDLREVQPMFSQIGEAAAAACPLPDLAGRGAATVAAKRAAVQVAQHHVPPSALCAQLEVSARTLRRLRSERHDPHLARAIALQLKLRTALASSAALESARAAAALEIAKAPPYEGARLASREAER